jgi:hypothetical protein
MNRKTRNITTGNASIEGEIEMRRAREDKQYPAFFQSSDLAWMWAGFK